MKIISLNTWGGRVYEELFYFLKRYKDVDIFCFQEIYHNAEKKMAFDKRNPSLTLLAELQQALPGHIPFFRPVIGDSYGIGMFVKKEIEVLEEGEVSIHANQNYPGHGGTHSRNLQWIECRNAGKAYSIMNVHGLWNGMGKTDTPERITQSQRIKDFMDTLQNPKILCGDFNLRPDTKSMHILEEGMNNLIKKYNIVSTRTSLYDKQEKFADYILVSPDIAVSSFKVLPDEVSDHAALFLECS